MIFFKNKTIKIHKETWGAILKTPFGELIIDRKQLKLFEEFETRRLKSYECLPVELYPLYDNQCILEISEEKAEDISPGITERLK